MFNIQDLNKQSQQFYSLLQHSRKRRSPEYLTENGENQNCKVEDHVSKIKEAAVALQGRI